MVVAQGSLKLRILRAGGWTLAGHVLSLVLRLGSSLITTRLLAPEIFGVMALTLTIMTVAGMLSDIGIRESIVRSSHGEESVFRNTAWTVQIVRGFFTFLATAMLGVAVLLAKKIDLLPANSAFNDPQLPGLILAISLINIIGGFQSTKNYLAIRNFEVSRCVQIELIVQIVGSSVTILLAWVTGSVWSLVVGTLFGSLLSVILGHVYLLGTPDQLAWHKDSLREIIKFGRWIAVSSAVSVIAINGDRLLLGMLLGPGALGLYSLALVLSSAVEGVLMKLITSVSFPALSEASRLGSGSFCKTLLKMRTLSDGILLFSAGILYSAGTKIVALLYDERYSGAGNILEILSFGLVLSRFSIIHQAYLALGHPKYVALISAVSVFSLLILVPMGYWWFGASGAIIGVALRYLPTLPIVFYANHKLRINNIRFELIILIGWVLGYAAGRIAVEAI